MSYVSVRNLTRRFDVSKPWLDRVIQRRGKSFLTAVDDVSFEIEPNTTYGLVGESGSGKSTIGKLLVGLLRPGAGTIRIGGEGGDIAARSDIQMIFQNPYASMNPRWRIRDIIAEPVAVQGGDTRGLAEGLLEQVGLSATDAARFPHEFSGGQRQRICIARALSSRPRLIICDEPTSALDVSVQAQVLNLMSDLKDELGLTYLFISHDLTVVRHMADRVGVLYLGRLVEEAATRDLFDDPKHPYTRMLIDVAPRIDAPGKEPPVPTGEIASPINQPPGCAYHPRCPLRTDICPAQRPALDTLRGTRVACHHAE